MENTKVAIEQKQADLAKLQGQLRSAYKDQQQVEKTFEDARRDWERAYHAMTGEWVYGSPAKVRKLWTPVVTDAYSAMVIFKENHKALKAEERMTRETLMAMRRAEKQAFRETNGAECQICARLILAQKGLVAHHGYTRPNGRGMWKAEAHGYQTASCRGARALPYEKSIDLLVPYLDALKVALENAEYVLEQFLAKPPASLLKQGFRRGDPLISVPKPEGDEHRISEYWSLYASAKWAHEREIRDLTEMVTFHQARVDNWKPRELKAMTVANS